MSVSFVENQHFVMLFDSGAIAFYEGNYMLSALFVKGNNMLSALAKYVINRLIHGLLYIALVTQIMLLLHMQIRHYFNKICNNERYW
jgi:hypothetical protein